MKRERLFYLDFIRVVSVLIILIYHFDTAMLTNKINGDFILFRLYPNGNLGTIGVSLFFIISGAALMYSYQNDFSLKKYISNRFFSIYPAYWVAYIAIFLFLFFINKTIVHSIPNIRFILTPLAMDGYLHYWIRNYYLIGEWFVGCIILLYFCFPLLRKFVIEKPLVLLAVVLVLYFVFVETYSLKMSINRNFLSRIPDLLLGMYFVQYIKKVKLYQFSIALIGSAVFLLVRVDINQMYKVTLIGVFAFIVLIYLVQNVKWEKAKVAFSTLSKYTFSFFLVHHVLLMQIQQRYAGLSLTRVEVYCLFLISLIVISLVAFYLYKITDKFVSLIKSTLIKQ